MDNMMHFRVNIAHHASTTCLIFTKKNSPKKTFISGI